LVGANSEAGAVRRRREGSTMDEQERPTRCRVAAARRDEGTDGLGRARSEAGGDRCRGHGPSLDSKGKPRRMSARCHAH